MTKLTKATRVSIWAVATVAAAVVGTTAGFAAAGAQSASAVEPSDWAASMSLLETPQGKADTLPPALAAGDTRLEGLRSDTSRFVGSKDGASYWAVIDTEGKLCFVASLAGPNQIAAASCAPTPDAFRATGVPLQIDSIDGAIRAYLVPDGASVDSLSVAALAPNLIVGDPYEPMNERIEVTLAVPEEAARADASVLELPSFEPVDGSWRD